MSITLTRDELLLSQDELTRLTNGLTQPAAQLRALHALGYVRAARPRGGPVVLSRAHYLAVEEHRANAGPKEEQNPHTGPNIVGLDQWAKKKRHGTQAHRR